MRTPLTLGGLFQTMANRSVPRLFLHGQEVRGPGIVTFGVAGAVETSASLTPSGTYVLQQSARDGDRSGPNQRFAGAQSVSDTPLDFA
jgi:hypothetical protein